MKRPLASVLRLFWNDRLPVASVKTSATVAPSSALPSELFTVPRTVAYGLVSAAEPLSLLPLPASHPPSTRPAESAAAPMRANARPFLQNGHVDRKSVAE